MAEGDSIHRLARRLDGRLKDAVITRVTSRTDAAKWEPIVDLRFAEVVPKGKHLLFRLTGEKDMTVHSHLRMQGNWTLLGAGKNLPPSMSDDVRLSLRLDSGETLVAIRMPVLDLIATRDEAEVVGHVGPDILAANFDIVEGAERLLAAGDRSAIQAILDQKIVSGVGNLWAVESMFIRGIYPWTPIVETDTVALLTLLQKMMTYSRDVHAGMVTTGDTRRGETHWVYGRYRKPCRRCTTPIDFRAGGSGPYDRETWWCPNCQPNS